MGGEPIFRDVYRDRPLLRYWFNKAVITCMLPEALMLRKTKFVRVNITNKWKLERLLNNHTLQIKKWVFIAVKISNN